MDAPPGATLYIDRKSLGSVGRAPRPLALAPGKYNVLAELDGYEPAQVAEFRSLGTAIAQSLLAHLDAEDPPAALARLEEASALAGDYGLHCGRLELPLSEAVAAFLRFRGPFIDELARTARQRGLDTREATELLVEAQTACDRLLLAFIEAWQLP